jgi:hypothetical protein
VYHPHGRSGRKQQPYFVRENKPENVATVSMSSFACTGTTREATVSQGVILFRNVTASDQELLAHVLDQVPKAPEEAYSAVKLRPN